MKITTEHYDQMKQMIDKVVTDYRELHQSDDLSSLRQHYVDKCTGTSKDWKKLFMWSMLYGVPYKDRAAWFDEVYKYANDDHIYTALKQAMKEYMQ